MTATGENDFTSADFTPADEETEARKDPEQIRQEIEATKDRIADSVEALAEVKADIDYSRSHPAQVLKEKVLSSYKALESKLDTLLGVQDRERS